MDMHTTTTPMSMSMSPIPAAAASTTMKGMAMPSSTSMSMSSSTSSMSMPMSSMIMTFFTSSHTPLFSTSWTPENSGQYAGTCIFLIVLAAVFRALVAIRFNLFAFLARVKGRRGAVASVENGGFGGGEKARAEWRPWRADEAVWIASVDVVIAGVSYLLMIAVMTMNVGYFMSVLAGVFLGSLAFGRFMAKAAAH